MVVEDAAALSPRECSAGRFSVGNRQAGDRDDRTRINIEYPARVIAADGNHRRTGPGDRDVLVDEELTDKRYRAGNSSLETNRAARADVGKRLAQRAGAAVRSGRHNRGKVAIEDRLRDRVGSRWAVIRVTAVLS